MTSAWTFALAAAGATLGFWGSGRAQVAVYDAANYGQLVSQVAESAKQLAALEQQIQQQSLMLAALPSNVSGQFSQASQRMVSTMQSSTGLVYSSQDPAAEISSAYPTTLPPMSPAELQATLQSWRETTRQALTSAIAVENAAVQSQAATAAAVDGAVAASQQASGQTAATQATNQIMAGVASQLLQLQSLLAAGQRAREAASAERETVVVTSPAESARVLSYAPPPSRLSANGQL